LFWTPADKLNDRHGPELERFREWIRLGLMTSIPGPVVRYDYIAREILALSKKYRFKVIAYDRWRIDDLKLELKSVGIEERDLPLEPFGQGFSRVMAPAIEYVQELALTGRLRHPSNAVLTASVCNAIVIPDKAGNQMLDKSASNRSGPVRIDGAVALTMALGTARRFELEPPRPFDLMFI
jgi:phage terminase large subunit-like protein